MKVVVDADLGAGGFVDPEHVLVEGGAVAVVVVGAVRHEEVGVDHLVQQGLHQVAAGPQLQQRHAQPVIQRRFLINVRLIKLGYFFRENVWPNSHLMEQYLDLLW